MDGETVDKIKEVVPEFRKFDDKIKYLIECKLEFDRCIQEYMDAQPKDKCVTTVIFNHTIMMNHEHNLDLICNKCGMHQVDINNVDGRIVIEGDNIVAVKIPYGTEYKVKSEA